MNKILHFKTNALLKNLVGKDLINDDNIAIVELVKNSYDANSANVLVKFTHFSHKEKSTELSKLIIAVISPPSSGCRMRRTTPDSTTPFYRLWTVAQHGQCASLCRPARYPHRRSSHTDSNDSAPLPSHGRAVPRECSGCLA